MSPKGKANAALAASLMFLLLSSCSAYFAFSRLDTSREWVWHTRDVQSTLAQFAMATTRAGRLRAEFVDSGDLSLLPRYAEAVSNLRGTMASIVRLTSDNSRQENNCARLQDLTEQRIKLMNDAIDLKRAGKSTLEGQNLITRQIVATAEQVDGLMSQMYADEDQLLADRQQRLRNSSNATIAILIASLFLALVLFILHHQLLSNQVRARAQAEAAQRTLSARVLTLQDQERRKFARELHDSVGQNLAAVKMGVSLLESKYPNDTALPDCLRLLDESIAETRTISYLLHPPMLDEAGLASAMRWFVEGFGKRSQINVNLEIQEGPQRLSEEIELVFFRVLQESLANVHRHSAATRADVNLSMTGSSASLKVEDNGRGMPDELLHNLRETGAGGGVGLAGMAERVREIGGRLEINSSAAGTEIVVRVPIRHRVQQQPIAQYAVQEVRADEVRG